jgi:ATP-dependent chaperone clpB
MGSHLIQEAFEKYANDTERAIETSKNEVLQLLKQTVRPEFLNRIDDIIMFTPLNANNIRSIVRLQLDAVIKMVAKEGITIEATDEAVDYLAQKGFDPQFGARPVKRIIQKEVLNRLSKEILGGSVHKDSVIKLLVADDKLVFEN